MPAILMTVIFLKYIPYGNNAFFQQEKRGE